jgi:hypothetical protein
LLFGITKLLDDFCVLDNCLNCHAK